MNKKTRKTIAVVFTIISAIALIFTIRESILSWIEQKKPLIVSTKEAYFSSSGQWVAGLTQEEVQKEYFKDLGTARNYFSVSRGSISLLVKNQNSKSELALSLSIPIRLLEYVKPIDGYYANVLSPNWSGGKGGGAVKNQYFYTAIDPNVENRNFASYIQDTKAFFNSDIPPVSQPSVTTLSDYYYLEPGDVEVFTVIFYFPEPGDYKFQVGVDMFTDDGEIETVWVDDVFEVSIAEGLNLWKGKDVKNWWDYPYSLENIASCTFAGSKFSAIHFLEEYNCGAPIKTDVTLDSVITQPSANCGNPPPRLEVGKRAHACSHSLSMYDYPDFEYEMTNPGYSFSSNATVIDGPVCNYSINWWRVLLDSGEDGWIYETAIMSGDYVLCPGDSD